MGMWTRKMETGYGNVDEEDGNRVWECGRGRWKQGMGMWTRKMETGYGNVDQGWKDILEVE